MGKKLVLLVILLPLVLVGMAMSQAVPITVRVVAPDAVGIATPFAVSVQVEDARGLAGWEGNLQFDPTAMAYIDTEMGDYIAMPYAVLPLGPQVLPGVIAMGQSSIKARVGLLSRVWLLPLAEGTWEIALADVTLTDIDAVVYPDVTVVPASVFLGPTPTPTFTLTPTATPTPTPTPVCICTFWDGSQTECVPR